MIQLKLVKGEKDDDDSDNETNQDNVPHGAKVLLKLLSLSGSTHRE